jgi:hypothetical protein
MAMTTNNSIKVNAEFDSPRRHRRTKSGFMLDVMMVERNRAFVLRNRTIARNIWTIFAEPPQLTGFLRKAKTLGAKLLGRFPKGAPESLIEIALIRKAGAVSDLSN